MPSGYLALELLGAAWATLFARLVVLFPLIYLCVKRFGLFGAAARTRPDGDVIRSIWRLGWPSSTQLVLRIAAMLVTHSLVRVPSPPSRTRPPAPRSGSVFRLETIGALPVGLG